MFEIVRDDLSYMDEHVYEFWLSLVKIKYCFDMNECTGIHCDKVKNYLVWNYTCV